MRELYRIGLLAILAAGLLAHPRSSFGGDAAEEARAALSRKEARRAVELFESALIDGDAAGRRAIREELRAAYPAAIAEAEASGDERLAKALRENLSILTQTGPPASSAAAPPVAVQPAARVAADPDLQRAAATTPEGVEPPAATAPAPANDLPAADGAFRDKDYDSAGRLYAALSAAGSLPESRNDHWAYCRCVEVVRRINAAPASAEEWAAVNDEITAIRKLAPRNWFGEYLRRLATQRSAAAPQPSGLIVRGADPDEEPPRRDPIDGDASEVDDPPLGNWQVLTTDNFRVFHADAALADRLAKAAESLRASSFQRWTGSPPTDDWTPRCDLYLYPTAAVYAERTGAASDTAGFATLGLENSRVIARRINLHADHPRLVEAVLPHELMHVVLADLFAGEQVPRWADEGLGLLAEPETEAATRQALLGRAIEAGELFRLATLIETDFPDGRHWNLFGAQGASLAEYLLGRGTPARFLEFVRGCAASGVEAELARVYGIGGSDELERLWLADVRLKLKP